jgi:hypothetical protein
MIARIASHNIHAEKWDRAVAADPLGLPYAYTWYLDLVAPHWEALVLNDYAAVMPLVSRRKWKLIPYAYRPYGTQQLGIFSSQKVDNKLVAEFLNEVKSSVWYSDIYLNEVDFEPVVPQWKSEPRVNLVLPLNRSYREVYEGYSSQAHRNLKVAGKSVHQLFEHDGPDVLINLFRRTKGPETRLRDAEYDTLRRIMFAALHRKRGYVWTVYGEGNQLECGVFLLQTPRRLIMLFSAVSEAGRETAAMTWLLNELFIHFSGMDWTFDFEGTNIANLARFYRSFGAETKTYHRMVYSKWPWP